MEKDKQPNGVEKDKQPNGFISRYVPKDWAPPAVAGLMFVATIHGTIEGKTIDVPAQAAGSAMSGSIGSSVAYSPFISVADTNFDRGYEARYATLRSDVEQGGGKGSTKEFRWFFPST